MEVRKVFSQEGLCRLVLAGVRSVADTSCLGIGSRRCVVGCRAFGGYCCPGGMGCCLCGSVARVPWLGALWGFWSPGVLGVGRSIAGGPVSLALGVGVRERACSLWGG